MNGPSLIMEILPITVFLTSLWSGSWLALPDLFGVLRTILMVLGGLVVVAIMLIVAVAIISGIMGMVGRLKRKS